MRLWVTQLTLASVATVACLVVSPAAEVQATAVVVEQVTAALVVRVMAAPVEQAILATAVAAEAM